MQPRHRTTRIVSSHDGYKVTTVNGEYADTIFKADVRNKLNAYELLPVMPPKLTAEKTVIIPGVDDLIYDWRHLPLRKDCPQTSMDW